MMSKQTRDSERIAELEAQVASLRDIIPAMARTTLQPLPDARPAPVAYPRVGDRDAAKIDPQQQMINARTQERRRNARPQGAVDDRSIGVRATGAQRRR